jgi:heat shock transcription factor, other eukaryote
MASQGLSRKRPAPGTSPTPYQTSYPPPPGLGSYAGLDPQVSNDQFLQFGYQPHIDNPQIPYNGNSIPQQSTSGGDVGAATNQLARRPANQVVSRDRGRGDSSDAQWTEQGIVQQLESACADDLDELRKRAQVAKREAQSKRKQIPPFVQKLAR